MTLLLLLFTIVSAAESSPINRDVLQNLVHDAIVPEVEVESIDTTIMNAVNGLSDPTMPEELVQLSPADLYFEDDDAFIPEELSPSAMYSEDYRLPPTKRSVATNGGMHLTLPVKTTREHTSEEMLQVADVERRFPPQEGTSPPKGRSLSHDEPSPQKNKDVRAGFIAAMQEDDKDFQVTSDTQLLQSKRKVTQFIDPLKIFTTVTDPTFHDKLADGLSTALCSKQQQTALQAAQNRIQQLSVELGTDVKTAAGSVHSSAVAKTLMKSIEKSIETQEHELHEVFASNDDSCVIEGIRDQAMAKANSTYSQLPDSDKLSLLSGAIKCHCNVLKHYKRAYAVLTDSDLAAKREHAYEQAQMMLCLQAGKKPNECELKRVPLVMPVNLDNEIESECPSEGASNLLGVNSIAPKVQTSQQSEAASADTFHKVQSYFNRDFSSSPANQRAEIETPALQTTMPQAATIKLVHADEFSASDWVKPGSAMWKWGLVDDDDVLAHNLKNTLLENIVPAHPSESQRHPANALSNAKYLGLK